MRIYISNNGQKQGPYSIEQVNSLVATGQLPVRTTLAWYEASQDFKIRLEDVPGIRVANSAYPPPLPLGETIVKTATEPANASCKPQKIRSAVLMLWITLGLGALRIPLEIPHHSVQGSVGFVVFSTVFTVLFVFLSMGFLIWMIDKGRNWARIIFLVLYILGLPPSIAPLFQSLTHAPISGILGVYQVILQAIAIVFLFRKESSDWFKLRKPLLNKTNG